MTQPDKPQGAGSLPQAAFGEEEVADYLAENLDFFARHPRLLTELDLRHAADGTVSLVDRQVQLLRTRNEDLQATPERDPDQRNGQRWHVRENADLHAGPDGCRGPLGTWTVPWRNTWLTASKRTTPSASCATGPRGWTVNLAGPPFAHLAAIGQDEEPPLARLFDLDDPSCNACRPEDFQRLFADADIKQPGSIALVPMHVGNTGTNSDLTATLVIGAKDPRRFSPDMGKVFLFYIGDVLARTLIRLGLG